MRCDLCLQAAVAELERRAHADHDAAADYFNWMKQAEVDKPTPIFQGAPVLNNFDLKNYFKNPQNAARENAMQALSELRSPKRPIGL